MDSEQRRKRKRFYKPYSQPQFFSVRSLLICLSFFVFLLFLSSLSNRIIGSQTTPSSTGTMPVLRFPRLSLFSLDSSHVSFNDGLLPRFRINERVQFPDHLMLLVSNGIDKVEKLDCVYYKIGNGSDVYRRNEVVYVTEPVISVVDYDEFGSVARCPLAPANYSSTVDLRRRGFVMNRSEFVSRYNDDRRIVHSWEKMVYAAVLDGETVVVFAKGLNLRPHKVSNSSYFKCRFGIGSWEKEGEFKFVTEAITAAQEVIRCNLPRGLLKNPEKAQGIRVTVLHVNPNERAAVSNDRHRKVTIPSVARINSFTQKKIRKKYDLCVCTMLWNQAPSLREWIMYHSWLGVERWFIYDNNSDDNIGEVIDELESQNYNVTRHTWPWIKTQEAGFSHCALRSRKECNWVGFFDVDEFFYFPHDHQRAINGQDSLQRLVANFSSSRTIAEIRTGCHSFGPSGLSLLPPQGMTVGYTCRLQSPERHKSIIRPDLLSHTLLNEVHHFERREGFQYLNVPESVAIINHYKYQVWERFRAKFYRRVATYVVDWQENQNQGSKDRAPGLGTEAIEPPDWRLRFCEVWDTGLRDLVLSNFADPVTAYLPWQRGLFDQ